MTTELQNKAWSVLPKEFKEEVKKLYSRFLFTREGYYDELFGKHNLTSDAEGEEMLTVPRKDIVELYREVEKTISQCKGTELATQAIGVKNTLWSFFGSKCLPDERVEANGGSSEANGGSNGDNLEPKPAEPKFKCGDRVRIIKQNHPQYGKTATVDTLVRGTYPEILVNLGGNLISFDESDLEPYTEPKENVNLSKNIKNCDKHFDNILRDSFSKERRLNVAVMAMQGLLANSHQELVDMKIEQVVQLSLEMADVLIAEAEKGVQYGK